MSELIHWADAQADLVIERCGAKKKKSAVCRSGQSPSGSKHIGNMTDNIRSFFVAKAINEKGFKAKHIQSCDDRDPMRKVPPLLADLDGKWKKLSEKEIKELGKYCGTPYVHIPDPCGCCSSWAQHYSKLIENGAKMIGLKTEYPSNDELYKKGAFKPYIRKVFEKIDDSRRIIQNFQESKTPDYIPFDVICENCGKIIGKATSFDLKNETIDYVCEEKKLAGEYAIKGCGHKGTAGFDGGKLPWRFEWPAQWCIMEADFEPVGKEHAEGSWPSGEVICKEIFESDPVIPFFTEFFLVDGKKMATREGNAYIIQDMMKIIEPEPFKMFYTKRPTKQRDYSVKEIFRLVDEFDKAEKIYFGEEKKEAKEHTDHEEENHKRMYELVCEKIPVKKPQRVPYQLCSTISQLVRTEDSRKQVLAKFGYTVDSAAMQRIKLAETWTEKYAPEEYRITLLEKLPEMKISREIKELYAKVAGKIESGCSGEELQQFIFNEAKNKGLKTSEVFSTAYKLLLGKERGPKLGPFLVSLDKDFAMERLKLQK